MKFSNDALVLMAHICNPRRYALPERMRYQWFLSQFHAAFAATIESSSSSSSMIPLTSDVDDDSKISKAPNDHQDKAVKESVLLDRAKEDENANAKDNVVDSVSFVLKELDLGRLAVQKTVEEETNCLTYQDSEASTNWLNHCASSVGPYFFLDDDDDASAETEPCPYGSDQEENFYSPLPSYSWDSGAYFPSSQEEDESAYGYSFNEDVRRELDPASDCNNYDSYAPKPDSPDDDASKLYELVKNCHIDPNHDCPTNVPLKCWDVTAFTSMNRAFYVATVPADVSFWDFSKVTSAQKMFYGTDLSNFDISKLKFDSLKDMSYLFRGAGSLGDGDVSAWDVSRVTSLEGTFSNVDKLPKGLQNWDVRNVRNMDSLFLDSFVDWDASPDAYGIAHWDVSSVTSMRSMFSSYFPSAIWRWDVRQVTDMCGMFSSAFHNPDKVKEIHLQMWDFHKDVKMESMFGPMYETQDVRDFADIDNHDLVRRLSPYFDYLMRQSQFKDHFDSWNKVKDENGVDTEHIDSYCPVGNAIEIDDMDALISKLEQYQNSAPEKIGCFKLTSGVTSIANVFSRAGFSNSGVPHGVWGWDVSEVKSMQSLFRDINFDAPLGIKNWDMACTHDAENMFLGADLSNVEDSVDLSSLKMKSCDGSYLTMDDAFLRATLEDNFLNDFNGDVSQWSNRRARNLSPFVRFVRQGLCEAQPNLPTKSPSMSGSPSGYPTAVPTDTQTTLPTATTLPTTSTHPSIDPTAVPTDRPTTLPTVQMPWGTPSETPSQVPSIQLPSLNPSFDPSGDPTAVPTEMPTMLP